MTVRAAVSSMRVLVTGPVNLGSPGEFTIRQLAEQILHLTGSRSKLVNEPLPEDDPLQRQPDIALACELLDWQPAIPLEDGLKRTIPYFRELLMTEAKQART